MDLKKREEKIKGLKHGIISSVNKRVSDNAAILLAGEKNHLLNDFEYSLGKISLESSPEGIGIGTHYLCNAKCNFCQGGNYELFSPEKYKNFFEKKLGRLIANSRFVNFCGFGELFLMPGIEKFLDYLNENIPVGVNKVFTTNGAPLSKEISALLLKGSSVVQVSLHASNSQLHKLLTGMDTFEQIKKRLKYLLTLRREKGRPGINLVFVLNTLNIEDLPDFISFASDLGVDEVTCNYMVIYTPAHLKLSCFFKQEITNRMLQEAEERAKKLNFSIRLPPRFGAQGSFTKPLRCTDPWKYFYVETEGSVLPCCYAGYHFGYLNNTDFEIIWNGSGYRNLRSSLAGNTFHEWCSCCPKHRPENIDDIRSHVSFIPGIKEKILEFCKL